MSDPNLAHALHALEEAKRAGADAAEAMIVIAREREIKVRMGEIERADSAVMKGIGLRVFAGMSQGLSHTTGFDRESMGDLAREAMRMARAAAPDHYGSLPEPGLTDAAPSGGLDLFDDAVAGLTDVDRLRWAQEAEREATSHQGIVNSEGSTFSDRTSQVSMANTNGLAWSSSGTRCSLVSRPVASDPGNHGTGQSQMWFTAARHLSDLQSPEEVGATAARRALRMIGARAVPTGPAAVIFDPLEAGRFWAGLMGAFSGDAARKGLSFLAGALGERVAGPGVSLVDDGRLPRGIASALRDGEGVPTRRKMLVEHGLLKTFMYDCRAGRRWDATTTASAVRSYRSGPSIGAFNFHMAPGDQDPEAIIRSTRRGLYLTQAIGFGTNLTSGDYSRGASGLWIEDGAIAWPVQEIVVSGNLRTMLASISAIGRDLTMRSGCCSPTFKIDEMMISGK